VGNYYAKLQISSGGVTHANYINHSNIVTEIFTWLVSQEVCLCSGFFITQVHIRTHLQYKTMQRK